MPLRRGSLPLVVLPLAPSSCGGGGGGGAPPAQTPVRLAADSVEIPTGAGSAELVVRLAAVPEPAPVLLEVAVELPPQLRLPPADRLAPATPVATLDGDFFGGRFVVLCGDAANAGAVPLSLGPLFRLRVVPAQPRQPGTYTVRLVDLRAASQSGGDAVLAEAVPATATVTIQ